jgi:hypothetical protein
MTFIQMVSRSERFKSFLEKNNLRDEELVGAMIVVELIIDR